MQGTGKYCIDESVGRPGGEKSGLDGTRRIQWFSGGLGGGNEKRAIAGRFSFAGLLCPKIIELVNRLALQRGQKSRQNCRPPSAIGHFPPSYFFPLPRWLLNHLTNLKQWSINLRDCDESTGLDIKQLYNLGHSDRISHPAVSSGIVIQSRYLGSYHIINTSNQELTKSRHSQMDQRRSKGCPA